ncbi:MAG: flagellar filament capping protein FliD [Fidelibacterota bacterium]|nr:MAG: flagellar filament capping protein FliD [Candidatus Neomarinimicrobiota bacterium]
MVAISTSSFGGLDIEGLVAQYRLIELGSRSSIEGRKEVLESRKEALSELDSKLLALYKLGERFSDIILDVFNSRQGSSSDSELFTVSAGVAAQPGSHDITISRLASIDTRVSQQYVATGTNVSDSFTGEQTFGILVAHPTDVDPNNREEITVTVSAATFDNKTNDEVLADIALAINNAMSAAVTAGTIDSDEQTVASVVSEETGTSRLVLRSGQSGETYSLQFNDTDGLLANLQVNAASQSTGTSGGYITAANELNSLFTIDGLAFTRDSNFVEDALEGVSIQLLGTTATTETITITTDTEAVKSEVQDFMDAYNEVIEFLNDKTATDGEFRGDSTYSTLKFQLRSIISAVVSNTETTDYNQLSEIGISINRDGTLYFEDETKFETALATNTSLVSDLFVATDGVAVALNEFVVNYTKTSGIISTSEDAVEATLRYQETRLENFDERLEKKVERFREQLLRLQSVYLEMQQQSAFFSNFSSQLSGLSG